MSKATATSSIRALRFSTSQWLWFRIVLIKIDILNPISVQFAQYPPGLQKIATGASSFIHKSA